MIILVNLDLYAFVPNLTRRSEDTCREVILRTCSVDGFWFIEDLLQRLRRSGQVPICQLCNFQPGSFSPMQAFCLAAQSIARELHRGTFPADGARGPVRRPVLKCTRKLFASHRSITFVLVFSRNISPVAPRAVVET
uniref:(northern house mosquito) hypothetical protein n=1 Tax=Culex pipiens TaxID=7175 RepID=A0A8D8B2N6_CULPI